MCGVRIIINQKLKQKLLRATCAYIFPFLNNIYIIEVYMFYKRSWFSSEALASTKPQEFATLCARDERVCVYAVKFVTYLLLSNVNNENCRFCIYSETQKPQLLCMMMKFTYTCILIQLNRHKEDIACQALLILLILPAAELNMACMHAWFWYIHVVVVVVVVAIAL